MKDEGKFKLLHTWNLRTSLGVPHGMDYKDGYLYYLVDSGKNVKASPHFIYKIKLDATSVNARIVDRYLIKIKEETEGLAIDSENNVYFGTARRKLYKLKSKLQDLHGSKNDYVYRKKRKR